MATHSSIPAWRITSTKESGGPQSISCKESDTTEQLTLWGFLGGTSDKEPICQCRGHKSMGQSLDWEDSPGGGHGNPLQYSCLENPMDRGTWQATIHRSQRIRHD